jgi:hypothetical protein
MTSMCDSESAEDSGLDGHCSIVLFGGGPPMGLDVLGETWTWDGTSWTQRDVEGPSPRYLAAMAPLAK